MGGTRVPTVPPRLIQVPAAWFEIPFEKALKKSIRPPTAQTRRKEITLKMVFPRVLFEELMASLSERDVPEITRTEGPNPQLIPTKTTAATRWFTYLVRKGSVSDKLFRFHERDPASPARRGTGCARARLSEAERRRGSHPRVMSMVAGNVLVKYKHPINERTPPVLTMTFGVLTMDSTGHITWPKDFESQTAAALRIQARALLQKMIADPLNPVTNSMSPALTGTGSSVRAIPPQRKMVLA